MKRFADDGALGAYVADRIASVIREKPDATLCIAAGTSSLPVFDALKAMVRAGGLSLSRAGFFAMDEWCGLPRDADGAMGNFLQKHFLREADFKDVFLFDGMADPGAECDRAEAFLAARGGIDVLVFGIGVNGHVALNEPGTDPVLRTHISRIAPVTAAVARKYFEADMPPLTTGVTIGIANAAEAGRVFIVANTPEKREAVERIERLAAAGTPQREVPASFVAALPQAELLVTESVFA